MFWERPQFWTNRDTWVTLRLLLYSRTPFFPQGMSESRIRDWGCSPAASLTFETPWVWSPVLYKLVWWQRAAIWGLSRSRPEDQKFKVILSYFVSGQTRICTSNISVLFTDASCDNCLAPGWLLRTTLSCSSATPVSIDRQASRPFKNTFWQNK